MSAASLSLLALLVVVGVSLTSRLNVGVLAVALAWGVGVFAAGWKAEQVMATFPSSLFLTLMGVTLLFGVAQANGSMQTITQAGLRAMRGHSSWMPLLLFALACIVSAMGPGAIAAVALLAPLAMGLAYPARVPMLLACVAWALFGGPALRGAQTIARELGERVALTRAHLLTYVVVSLWIGGVLFLKLPPGLTAFAAAALLVLLGAGDDSAMLKQVPWPVITMVCGVSVLIGVLEKTGGMDLFTTLLSRLATPGTVNGVIGGVTGLISTYSSTSGVVYPAFLPAIPGRVAKLGGGNPLEIALSINVGAALVDVSPLSTIGGLCIAAVPAGQDTRRLFRQLLLWGFAMSVVGVLFCQTLIPLFVV